MTAPRDFQAGVFVSSRKVYDDNRGAHDGAPVHSSQG